VALCGEKGLVSGFPNTIVFALLPYAGGTPARAHVCGENDLGFGSSHKKKIFVFSVALCDLCGENVLEVGFPNKNSF